MKQPHKKVSDLFSDSSRIVIKIGSALIAGSKTLTVRKDWMKSFAADVSSLIKEEGKEIIIVSSGAVALGRDSAGHTSFDKLSIVEKQSAAAMGQIHLMKHFMNCFDSHELNVAQILLERRDLDVETQSCVNFRNTNDMLLKGHNIPIINENDVTATEELQFGDNDVLSARVAETVEADLLVILSKLDGFYTNDPHIDASNAQHIPYMDHIMDEHKSIAGASNDNVSTGGMKTKIQAVEIAWSAGIPVVLGSGRESNPLAKIRTAKNRSTLFVQNHTCS